MTRPASAGRTGRRPLAMGGIGALAAAVVLALCGMSTPASAADLSEGDVQCLACHGMQGPQMPVGNGENLSLHIEGDTFRQSIHGRLGCTGCHTDIKLSTHPAAVAPIKSRRDFSIAMIQTCRNCHNDQFEQWNTSVHEALVRDGNPIAPICTSCHSPHAVMVGVAESMDTVPCKNCHGAIFAAYAPSVHGVARSRGDAGAPLCFGCHGAHAVHVPSEIQGLKDVCLGCHTDAVEAHRTWLPNVDLHFDVVSCLACHAPNSHRRVDLVLFNSTTQKAISEPEGVPEFQGPTDFSTTESPNVEAATLFTMLKTLNSPGAKDKTVIKGRLEVSSAVEAHGIAPSEAAISDCNTCHRAGANAFQSVVVSVGGVAGVPIYYGTNMDVLTSFLSVESIGGFYAIGGTRITLLDVLFVLALVGGIGGATAHLIVRLVFRRYLNRTPKEQRKG